MNLTSGTLIKFFWVISHNNIKQYTGIFIEKDTKIYDCYICLIHDNDSGTQLFYAFKEEIQSFYDCSLKQWVDF